MVYVFVFVIIYLLTVYRDEYKAYQSIYMREHFSTIGINKVSSNAGWFKRLRALTVLAEQPGLIDSQHPFDGR